MSYLKLFAFIGSIGLAACGNLPGMKKSTVGLGGGTPDGVVTPPGEVCGDSAPDTTLTAPYSSALAAYVRKANCQNCHESGGMVSTQSPFIADMSESTSVPLLQAVVSGSTRSTSLYVHVTNGHYTSNADLLSTDCWASLISGFKTEVNVSLNETRPGIPAAKAPTSMASAIRRVRNSFPKK